MGYILCIPYFFKFPFKYFVVRKVNVNSVKITVTRFSHLMHLIKVYENIKLQICQSLLLACVHKEMK